MGDTLRGILRRGLGRMWALIDRTGRAKPNREKARQPEVRLVLAQLRWQLVAGGPDCLYCKKDTAGADGEAEGR